MGRSGGVGGELRPLEASDLAGDALEVAPRLLNRIIVGGGVVARLVDVEAYTEQDPASHAFRGWTPRCASMFAGPGTLYVYLSYGIHRCINVVTGPEGSPQAVLVRGVEVLDGLATARSRRGEVSPAGLGNGPGKVGQLLGVELAHDATSLMGGGPYRLFADDLDAPVVGRRHPRVGITKAVDRLWRFTL